MNRPFPTEKRKPRQARSSVGDVNRPKVARGLRVWGPVLASFFFATIFATGTALSSPVPADSARFQLRGLFYQAKQARDNQQWEQAADLYLSLSQKREKNPYRDDAAFWYAFCLQKADSVQSAALAYERYLEEFPNGKYAASAEARLRNLLDQLSERERAKIRALIQKMKSRKAKETRRRLIEALSRDSSTQDLPLLITLLQKERDPSLRVFLVQTLGRSGDPDVVHYLVQVAKEDNNRAVQQAAVRALGRITTDNSYLELINLMNTTHDPAQLDVIVSSLASSGKARSLPVLARLVRSRQNSQVSTAAIREIARLASPASWDTLVQMALDPSLALSLRRRAVNLLPPTLTKTRLDAATFRELLKAARASGDEGFVRSVLITATRVSDKTFEEISPELFDLISPETSPNVTSFVLGIFAHRGLGRVPPERFLELCDRFDEEPLRVDVLRALKRYDPSLAVQGLRRLLSQDRPLPDLDRLVGFLPPEKAVEVLEQALSSEDPARRQNVVKALAFVAFREPRATELLIHTAESDSDYEVRQSAFQALARMPSPKAREAVRRLANEFYR